VTRDLAVTPDFAAREVVPGSAVLSMISTLTPSRVSQSASTRPVGPAPTTSAFGILVSNIGFEVERMHPFAAELRFQFLASDTRHIRRLPSGKGASLQQFDA
jgi:hypothetical protein